MITWLWKFVSTFYAQLITHPIGYSRCISHGISNWKVWNTRWKCGARFTGFLHGYFSHDTWNNMWNNMWKTMWIRSWNTYVFPFMLTFSETWRMLHIVNFFYNLAGFVFEYFCDSRRILATFAKFCLNSLFATRSYRFTRHPARARALKLPSISHTGFWRKKFLQNPPPSPNCYRQISLRRFWY